MEKVKQQKGIVKITIFSAVVAAVVLILGTILTGRSASLDTQKAVRNVSLLYLDELAGRRSEVVASRLSEYIKNLDVTVGLLTPEDLAGREALQAYQARMKQLYDLEKFAFVDRGGTIHTSRGTRDDIDKYPFDYAELSESFIGIKNLNSLDKKVIIAVPIDNLPYEGTELIVCFMEFSVDNLLNGIALRSDNNNTTFCNIYTKEGIALTDLILGGLAQEDNLLLALENARFEGGASADTVRRDFSENRAGVVSFSYNNIKETLCYEPIKGTDWMLTYLIRESVIGEQISTISESIISRSLCLSLCTAGVLIVMFGAVIVQGRKAARATLEKEVQEAENRVKQDELEEQLALQDELAQAVRNAEKANEAKTAFLSNMSHEIRTPITAVLGMNEMIQRESEDENILSYSDNIRSASESLLGIINDILDFSKIESGHMEISEVDYALGTLLGDLYNLVRFRAEDKGLKLTFSIDPSLSATLHGDELRVKQVITNLLTNAVKYTEKGSVTLSIRSDGRTQDTLRLFVCVADTGIGIREDEMDKLFNEFDRLDYKRNRTIEGTGLGLAISRQILRLMGSDLAVESVYGEGSKFYFTLEQTVVDDTRIGTFDVTELAPADHKKRSTTTFTAPDARMLIVDDTPMNLKVLTGLLKRTGITIDTAASGEECIRFFGENSYDIIFLDYRMPRLDGIETMLKLRDIYPQKAAHTPIISLTASAIAGDREKMLAAGFDDYLTKPVVISEMERVILQYLPPEKIRKDTDTKQDRPEVLSDELPSALYSIPALDCESGLTYCGDAEDYLDALRDYTDSLDDRIEKITAALLQDDRENYTIYVHSLKSMSRAVGAETIAEAAARLEAAGNDGDTDTMQRDTEKVLKMCREMKEHLDEALG